MKNIVIFEGIASSGKTALEKLLSSRLPGSIIVSEESTLMPIINNKDSGVAFEYLHKQMEMIAGNHTKNIIVDRFHFTHAFRTDSSLETFAEIETELQAMGSIIIILLTINPEQIKKRIEETITYRKDAWKKGAQGNIDEKVVYYTKQQEILKTFASLSRLPIYTIDTTAKDWEVYVDKILARMNQSAS